MRKCPYCGVANRAIDVFGGSSHNLLIYLYECDGCGQEYSSRSNRGCRGGFLRRGHFEALVAFMEGVTLEQAHDQLLEWGVE